VARSIVTEDRAWKEASYIMLHVGLDLSRKRVDVCLISDQGELVDGERVLVIARFSARGKTSGLDLGHMRTEGASLFWRGAMSSTASDRRVGR
jgi:hypothetical protein